MIYDKFRNTDVQTGEDICGPELGQIKLIIIIINNLPSTFYNFFEKQNKIKFAKQNKTLENKTKLNFYKTEQNFIKPNVTKKIKKKKNSKTKQNFYKTKQNKTFAKGTKQKSRTFENKIKQLKTLKKQNKT